MSDMRLWNLVYEPLDRACSYFKDRTAIIDGDRRLNYRELGEFTNRVANGLIELGVRPGEAIGMLMPNCLEFIPTQHGLWKAGAVMVQMPARASADDQVHFLLSSSATTLIYHAEFDEVVERIREHCPSVSRYIRLDPDLNSDTITVNSSIDFHSAVGGQSSVAPDVAVRPEDIASIAFTSGSTGAPKAVLNSHESTVHFHIPSGSEIGDVGAGEVFALGAPLTHFAQIFVLPTFLRGGTVVMLPGLDVDMLFDAIERYKVTATALVPTVIYLMLAHPRLATADFSTLRTIVYAGSPMAPDRLREAVEVFGPVFSQTYAGTEPTFMTCLTKEDHVISDPADVARLSSAGRAMSHVTLSVQDEDDNILAAGEVGEICSRQAGQMVGYVDSTRDHETIRDGWVHTGDIGYIDEDGYVFIVDRKKDMVVTGGFNVFPRQIEDVLLQHPGVGQCAVIGVPDEKWGEAVKAMVVAARDIDVSGDELITLVKERKGSVWAPKTVEFIDSLPMTANGKIDKKTLKEPFWAGRDRLVH